MYLLAVWAVLYTSTFGVVIVSLAYLYFKHVTKYFSKHGVPFEPAVFPLGILGPLFTLQKSYSTLLFELYNKHKKERFVGIYQFWKKSILINDLELIRLILVKDFEYFNHKNIHHNRELEPLSAHLFAIDGYEWKVLRAKMSPAFSSGKLKGMFGTVEDVCRSLEAYMTKLTAEHDVLECRDVFMRYGLGLIANTAFGLESDVLSDKSSLFFKMAEKVTSPTLSAMIRIGMMFYGRDIAKAFNLKILPADSHEFFLNLIKDTIDYRDKNNKTRNDFLQILMDLRTGGKHDDKDVNLTLYEIAAQCFIFIVAGYETVSNSSSFFLYEMALNPDIQRRIQAEVDAVDGINHNSLASMEYLDMAVDETLRKYTSLGFLGRNCSQDYRIPGSSFVIEKGTEVLISLHGLHNNPDLFPEPERFNPERFSRENKEHIKPFSYMPFGEGPRFCIGMRWGKMVVKAALATLMKRFEVQVDEKTPIPLKFQAKTITNTAAGGMWLKFVRR